MHAGHAHSNSEAGGARGDSDRDDCSIARCKDSMSSSSSSSFSGLFSPSSGGTVDSSIIADVVGGCGGKEEGGITRNSARLGARHGA